MRCQGDLQTCRRIDGILGPIGHCRQIQAQSAAHAAVEVRPENAFTLRSRAMFNPLRWFDHGPEWRHFDPVGTEWGIGCAVFTAFDCRFLDLRHCEEYSWITTLSLSRMHDQGTTAMPSRRGGREPPPPPVKGGFTRPLTGPATSARPSSRPGSPDRQWSVEDRCPDRTRARKPSAMDSRGNACRRFAIRQGRPRQRFPPGSSRHLPSKTDCPEPCGRPA